MVKLNRKCLLCKEVKDLDKLITLDGPKGYPVRVCKVHLGFHKFKETKKIPLTNYLNSR